MTVDMVNHPPHYREHPVFSGECHDYAGQMFFDQGNAFKYLWRFEGKGGDEDMNKAYWYLNAATHARQLPAVVIDRMEDQILRYVRDLKASGRERTAVDDTRVNAGYAMIALAHGDPVAALRALTDGVVG